MNANTPDAPKSQAGRTGGRRRSAMSGINPVAIVLFCAVAACSPAPDSSAGGAAIQTASQDAARPEIPAERIVRDVIGRVVMITGVDGKSHSTDWTFEAAEFKQVEILAREGTAATTAITVFMTTRNNPGPDEDAVQVTGKLRLHYQRKGAAWVLTTIENLSFRYTIGIST